MKLLVISQTEDAYSHDNWSVVTAMYITQDHYFAHWCAKMKDKATLRKSCCGVRVQCLDIDTEGQATLVGSYQHLVPPKKRVEINKAPVSLKDTGLTATGLLAALQQLPTFDAPPVQGGF